MRFLFLILIIIMSSLVASENGAAFLQDAISKHKSGQLDEAVKAYIKALKHLTGTSASQVSSNIGAIYMTKGEYALASKFFEKAIDNDSTNAMGHFNLAVVLTTKLNEHTKAIKHCAKAIKIDSKMVKAYHLMGNILQNIGQHDEAERYFSLADQMSGQTKENEVSKSKANDIFNDLYADNILFSMKVGDTKRFTVSNSGVLSSNDGDNSDREVILACISTEPYLFHVSNLLSGTECEHIRSTAAPKLQASEVMGKSKAAELERNVCESAICSDATLDIPGASKPSYRSSYNAWLPADDTILSIQNRLAAVMGISAQYIRLKGEELQVVHYPHGGEFRLHHDSSTFHIRHFTCLFYLTTVPTTLDASYGETWFPFANTNTKLSERNHQPALSVASTVDSSIESALRAYHAYQNQDQPLPGVRVSPIQGNCVIFVNHRPAVTSEGVSADITLDIGAIHAGLPVLGKDQDVEKWVANFWF